MTLLRIAIGTFVAVMAFNASLSGQALTAQERSPIFDPPPLAGPANLPPPIANEPVVRSPEDLVAAQPEATNTARKTRPLVVDVIVQGVRDEDRARSYIRTKKEYEYDAGALQSDVRRLITSNQYQNVRTLTRNVAEGVVVIFELSERPKVNYILFHGNRGFSDKKLLKTAELKQGEPLNSYDVDEGRRRIEELYHSKGYPKAQVGILEGDKPTDKGVAYVVSEGYLQRINSVTFEGNVFASDSVLRTKIESKPGYLWYLINGKLSRAKLDADVEKLTAYYHDFGFFRARVGRELTFDEEGRWASIKFVVDEGQRYNVRGVSIVGNQKFSSDPLIEAMKLKANTPFSRGAMNKDLGLLRDLYGSQGHIFADVQANPRFLEEPGQIDLIYKIQEGEPFRVGQVNVHIAGEFPHTRRNVVLNKLSLRPGDLIDMRQVRDSERRLKFSQLFDTEQTGGESPRIVIRPPELADGAAAPGKGFRGQSPDSASAPTNSRTTAPANSPATFDIDVFVPQMRGDATAESASANYTAPPYATSYQPSAAAFRRLPAIEREQ